MLGLDKLIDPRLAPYVDESRAFRVQRAGARGPSTSDELQQARAQRSTESPSDPPAVQEVIKTGATSVPIRIFTPVAAEPCCVVLDIHGGGFYMGSAGRNDVRNRQLAESLGLAVVSIDYRLAPEHPWPAAPDDCEAAALWLIESAESRFGTTRFTISGISAGATLAMTTLLRLRDRGVDAFAGAVLQFGTYDLSGQTPAGRLITDEYFLEAYVGHVPDRCTPDISPIYAELGGLPPVLMIVGGSDILLEDNMAMTARLSAASADVDLRIYPESPHGFTFHPTTMARIAIDDIDTWLAERIGCPQTRRSA
jgi:acetyl esterase